MPRRSDALGILPLTVGSNTMSSSRSIPQDAAVVIAGVYHHYDDDGVHDADELILAVAPVERIDGRCRPEAPHRCWTCRAVYIVPPDAHRMIITDAGDTGDGRIYQILVPICPACWRDEWATLRRVLEPEEPRTAR